MAKKKTDSETEGLSFEDAIAKVEALVEEMENDQLPLEKLVEHYEKGSTLLARSEKLLQGARKRIELITINPQEVENALEDAKESANDSLFAASDDDTDEIRLF